jgi:chromosome segregation ATPase
MFGRERKLDFPILKQLESEMVELQSRTDAAQSRIGELDFKTQQSDQRALQTSNMETMSEASRVRARAKADAEALEAVVNACQYRLDEARREHAQWRNNFETLLDQKTALYRKLGEARDEERLAKTRSELLPVLTFLAHASGDKKTLEDVARIEKEIKDALPYIIAPTCFYLTRDKKLLSEAQLNKSAIEGLPIQGATTFFGKGTRIDRAEAQRWGLIPKEAA